MRIKQHVLREGIERLGGISRGEFTTAGGEQANRKIDLDVLYEHKHINRILFHLAVGDLATKIAHYSPDLIVPIPKGADRLGAAVAQRLQLPVSYLSWLDKTPGSKEIQARTGHYKELIRCAGKIALIDDVFTSGSSLVATREMAGMRNKDVIAGVVWNRHEEHSPSSVPFVVESVIHEPLQLWVEETE